MAKFFWNYLRIKPSFAAERLSPIEEALEWQEWFLGLRRDSLIDAQIKPYNFIFFAEHDHVYAYPPKIEEALADLEKRSKYLKTAPDKLPAPLLKLPDNNGGSITYHGPGQLVCYLILGIEDLGLTILAIDAAVKEVLKNLAIEAYTLEQLIESSDDKIREQLLKMEVFACDAEGKPKTVRFARGIWVVKDGEARKIASRGLKLTVYQYGPDNNSTAHFTKYGFALNISTDLAYFAHINPCGLPIEMTSVEQLTGKKHSLPKIAKMLAETLVKKFSELSGETHELI